MTNVTPPLEGSVHLRALETFVRANPEALMVIEGRPLGEPGPRIVLVSDGFIRMTGYQPDELIGRGTGLLVGRLTDREALQRIRLAMQAWQPTVERLVTYRKDGSPCTVQVQLMPLAGVEGLPSTHYIVTYQDVTDFDRASRLMAQMATTARVGGWEVDLGTQRVYWTAETYRIHDTSPTNYRPTVEEAISFYSPACQPVIREAVRQAIADGTRFDLELDLITATGREVRVRAVGEADRDSGQTVRLYGSVQDVTAVYRAQMERELFQFQLQQTQKLESLGVMAGGIAHDFNNLLTGIIGFAELARASVAQASTPSGYLDKLIASAERAADLCKQMLAYAGKNRLATAPVALNRVIEEALPLLHMTVSKRAALTVCLDPGLPPVLGDAAQLGQVLMNLVINASEALGDADGAITVRTSVVTGDPELPPTDHICLEVSDTGRGMDEATRSRIFEPFFSTKFVGRGLGLAAVGGIIRGHRGVSRVESRVGSGTTFRVYLPVTEQPGQAPEPVQPVAGYRGEGTVLVVDDEPTVREVTARRINSLGFATVEARDGREGLDQVARATVPFRIILLDVTMPQLDGIETLRELRMVSPGVPVILMSGFSEHELTRRYGDSGLTCFLQKPFSHDDLVRAVRQALS